MTTPVIEASNLSMKFSGHYALDHLNVRVQENEIVGLIGPNGAGKTTFLRLCAGLLKESAGKITVFGSVPMDNLSVLSRLIYSNAEVDYPKGNRLKAILQDYERMFPLFDITFANNLLAFFGLREKAKYSALSTGNASIFNFICALATRAELTLLDEPVLGMDVGVRKTIYEILLRDYTEHPRTFLISSHLLSELEPILSEIILIDHRKLIFHKKMDEIRSMAYRVDGDEDAVRAFALFKDTLYFHHGNLGAFRIIQGAIDEQTQEEAKKNGVSLSSVKPEDLCMFLTKQNKEDELSCLWNARN